MTRAASPVRPSPIAVEPDSTQTPRLLASSDDPSFDGHFHRWGQVPKGGHPLIDEVERAGLRGRGGASFPTARKLAAVAAGRRPIVVGNGTEGEPASMKDKVLMLNAPHLVLDGLSIAAETVGATEAVICVERRSTAAVTALRRAMSERLSVRPDQIDIRLETMPSHYVAGEESALVHWLNGGESKPTVVPPRPYERGVNGRPTLINNVETLADLALIARFGATWFRGLGTREDPGTALISVVGDVARPGVFEFALGTPVEAVLRTAGAGSSARSVLAGGYAGTWIPAPTALSLTLDRASFASAGAVLGCGSLLVLSDRSCGITAAARIARWMASQTAGQCGPCVNGLPSIAGALDAMVKGGQHRREQQLMRWLDMVEGRGACHHPDGAARMVRSALRTFADEIEMHRRRGPCGLGADSLPLPKIDWSWR